MPWSPRRTPPPKPRAARRDIRALILKGLRRAGYRRVGTGLVVPQGAITHRDVERWRIGQHGQYLDVLVSKSGLVWLFDYHTPRHWLSADVQRFLIGLGRIRGYRGRRPLKP